MQSLANHSCERTPIKPIVRGPEPLRRRSILRSAGIAGFGFARAVWEVREARAPQTTVAVRSNPKGTDCTDLPMIPERYRGPMRSAAWAAGVEVPGSVVSDNLPNHALERTAIKRPGEILEPFRRRSACRWMHSAMTSLAWLVGLSMIFVSGCVNVDSGRSTRVHESLSRIVPCAEYATSVDVIALDTDLARIEVAKPVLIAELGRLRQTYDRSRDSFMAARVSTCIDLVRDPHTHEISHFESALHFHVQRSFAICLESGSAQVFNKKTCRYEPEIEIRAFTRDGVGNLDGCSGFRYYMRGGVRPFFYRVVMIS